MSPSPAEPGTAKAAAPPAVAVPAEPSPAGAAAIAGPSTGATAAAHTSSRPPPCTPEPAETSALDRAGIATSPGLDPTASASQAVPEVPADGETPPIARPAILATPAGARPPRLIVAVGNCQVAAMAGLFRKFSAARTGDRIEAIASYQDLSAEALDMIGQADVLIEQILDVAPKADVVGIPATAQRLYIPSVSASFLWPFAGQAHPRNFVPSFMTVGPYGGEAGDSMLNRFIAAGTDPEQAVETYMALDARARINLDRLFELVMDRQRSRDATAGYRTADTIESYFRTEQIFLSPFHPNLRVALSLATQFFQQLGASQDDIDRLHRYTRVAPFPRDELPIHPSVAKHFDLTWALPDKRYRFMNEGSFTAREYALRYIHFTWNEPLEEGLALIRSGTTEAAEEKLKAGLALSPQSASAHASLARLYATRPADRGAAYAAIRRAVELEPDSAAYLGMLGNFLREDGVADEAEPILRRALAAAPEDSYYYLILAILLRQIGRHREACDLMQQATEIEPYIAQLRAQRAEFLEAAGELEAAIEQLDAAMRLESGNSTWLQRRLGLLTRLGRLDDAIEAARQSLATTPHDVRTRVVLSQLLCRANRVTEGLMEAYNAAIHQPPHADAFAQLGAALRQNNDFDPAERAFLRAIELAPEVAHFHHELSVIHAQRKNWGAAVAAASEAIAREPSNPARLMHIAGLLAARGDHAGAASAIRKAVDMSPDNATYRIALGRALVEQGKAAEALLGFQVYALAHAEDTQVLAHLAYLQEQNGDAAAAERTVRQALERDPGNTALHRQLEALTARREPASAAAYRVIV
ncbi:MAG: WcbI family polysaccharide biosynthesis putative acetyltransferase [Acetobacteraceae bacterium]